jgi:hypothetical protein
MIDKWRYLLEPLVNESLCAIPWEQVREQDYILFELEESVLVANSGVMLGKKALQIWLAAGIMDQVDILAQQAEDYGRANGFELISYCGRKGWVRSHGYKEVATVGVKNL